MLHLSNDKYFGYVSKECGDVTVRIKQSCQTLEKKAAHSFETSVTT